MCKKTVEIYVLNEIFSLLNILQWRIANKNKKKKDIFPLLSLVSIEDLHTIVFILTFQRRLYCKNARKNKKK